MDVPLRADAGSVAARPRGGIRHGGIRPSLAKSAWPPKYSAAARCLMRCCRGLRPRTKVALYARSPASALGGHCGPALPARPGRRGGARQALVWALAGPRATAAGVSEHGHSETIFLCSDRMVRPSARLG